MTGTPKDDELLRQYLAERSVPCPRCKYDLRNLEAGVCPECGQPVRLTVSPDRPIWRSFVAGLVALAAAAGCNGLMLLFFLFLAISDGGMGLGPWVMVTGAGLIVSLAALRIWFRMRVWLLRRRAAVRRICALACWILPLLTLAALIWTMLQF